MKIKGSAKKLTAKAVIIAAAVLGGLLLALRCWQSFALIDPATGFFTDHKNITVMPSYILAVGIALIVPLLAYLTPLSKAEYIAPAKRPLHALGCLALGAAIALDAVKPLFGEEKTRLTFVTALLGAAAAVALINCNTAFLTGGDSVRKVKILMVFPALWALAKTLTYFSYYTSYIKTSALLIAACQMGVAAAGGTEEQLEAAGLYAAAVGLAFQIRDDMLDVLSTEQELGKPIGSDAQEQKNTFMALYGEEKCAAMIAKLTERAKEALKAGFDDTGFLCALADSMAVRRS